MNEITQNPPKLHAGTHLTTKAKYRTLSKHNSLEDFNQAQARILLPPSPLNPERLPWRMTKWVWIYTKTEENVTPCLSSLGSPMAEMQRDCPSFLMNSSPGTPLAHRQASLEPREMKKKKKKFPFYGL